MVATIDIMVQLAPMEDGVYMIQKLSKPYVTEDGDVIYLIENTKIKHRVNAPTVFYANSELWYWYLYDNPHRYYGPANNWTYELYYTTGMWVIHGKSVKPK